MVAVTTTTIIIKDTSYEVVPVAMIHQHCINNNCNKNQHHEIVVVVVVVVEKITILLDQIAKIHPVHVEVFQF